MGLPLRNLTNHTIVPDNLLDSVRALARLIDPDFRNIEHDLHMELGTSSNAEDIELPLNFVMEKLVYMAYKMGITAQDAH